MKKKHVVALLLLACTVSLKSQQGQVILGGVVLEKFTEDTLNWSFVSVYDHQGDLLTTARTQYPSGRYEIKNLNCGIYMLKAWRYGSFYPKIIRNVFLHEGFTNWYPRLERDTTVFRFPPEEDIFFSDMNWEEEEVYEAPSIFPNPAKEYIQIAAHEGFRKAKIYNIKGKVVKEFALEPGQKTHVGELITGIYICRIEAPEWSFSYPLKFVKL